MIAMDLKAIGRRIKAAREVKLAHLWGFLWGNAFFPEVVPGYTPDTALTARYVQMASMDIGFPIRVLT